MDQPGDKKHEGKETTSVIERSRFAIHAGDPRSEYSLLFQFSNNFGGGKRTWWITLVYSGNRGDTRKELVPGDQILWYSIFLILLNLRRPDSTCFLLYESLTPYHDQKRSS
jgi:hypothetical protein